MVVQYVYSVALIGSRLVTASSVLASYIPRLSVTTRANEGGEPGDYCVHALIVLIMVMTTFYAYVIIIRTVTSHEHCVQDSVIVVVFLLMNPSRVCRL